jgi:alkylation response protein AidB-like acyl-CoA dehydrogenase
MNFDFNPAQKDIQARARRFAQEEVLPIAREADEKGEFPLHLVRRMAELGFLAGPLEPEYGGAGMDHLSFALVCEELGRADASVRGFLTVQASLVCRCIRDWGTEEQRRRYLPRLASGEWIGCYALTEPGSGSDVASLQTSAREEEDHYVLSGEKIWITNGTLAHLAVVFATVDPSARHKGICAFLVETGTPGFRREQMPGRPLGHRASDHARIILDACRVPRSALLGAPHEGFQVALSALDHGRVGVAAGAVGLAQACLEACLDFTTRRRQFGQRIADFQAIQMTLADMATEVDAARLLTYRAAWMKDQGLPATKETSIAKLFATEVAARAASEAVLIHGSRGYSNTYPVERHYRDVKGLQIYEGTSHIQRLIIARDLIVHAGR